MWSEVTSIIFSAIYLVVALGIALVVISENRNPIKALSWVMVVLLIPAVGIILYYFFGQDLRHTHTIHRKIYRRLSSVPYSFEDYAIVSKPILQKPQYRPVEQLCERLGDSPVLAAQEIKIFTTGHDKFEALFADIRAAKQHIHLQYYAIESDRLGNQLADLLIQKVREGVIVRILYDDVGSWGARRSFWKRMRKSGVQVYPFMKVVIPYLSSRVNYRNHRKLAIIDGEIGYMGGMNIADRYYYGNEMGPWRDTHFRLTGGIVAELQTAFLIDWYLITRRVVHLRDYFPKRLSSVDTPLIPMQFFLGSPMGAWRSIEQAINYLILRATRRICIETPYFLPTQTLNEALAMAALGGVEVNLLIPRKGDVLASHLASLSYLDGLMEAGVHVYFYKAGFLHSKFLTIDGEVALVGSANMDFRSFEHNFECASIIYEAGFTQQLEEIFAQDLDNSEPVIPTRWRNRKRWRRFCESIMRLFSPLL